MAKAREIDGLNCSDNAVEGIHKVLRVRFDEVIERRETALDFSDVKGVHDMRVATRRLRSALRDFAPLLKKNTFKDVKVDLKSLADALGNVRDRDVEIIALENLQFEANAENIREGIDKFIREKRNLREITQSDLTKALAIEKLNDVQEQFVKALDKAVNSKESDQNISFKDFGRIVITANLQEFCDLSSFLYEPFNICNLHRLRISSKRLRYSMQLFASCWDKEMKQFAKEISNMQSFLGEIHDYDVWIENLSKDLKFLANESQSSLWLLSNFVEQRTKQYTAMLKLWNNWQMNYFIARLKAMIL